MEENEGEWWMVDGRWERGRRVKGRALGVGGGVFTLTLLLLCSMLYALLTYALTLALLLL